MAASAESARRGAYYAHPGNRFWPTLAAVGLTPRRLAPEEFDLLPGFGIGLTDVCKAQSGADHELDRANHDAAAVLGKIRRWRPRAVAFNSKNAAQLTLGRKVAYGRQADAIGGSSVFVLPSTSGRAVAYWDLGPWREVAQFIGRDLTG
ncbi:MAG: mismatch-specific DNA-glycosylase [Alphaproteobacteria bacterium]|nr:mismatch-specific DNA-glycosylase [Alphaproteobacteria bacterium]